MNQQTLTNPVLNATLTTIFFFCDVALTFYLLTSYPGLVRETNPGWGHPASMLVTTVLTLQWLPIAIMYSLFEKRDGGLHWYSWLFRIPFTLIVWVLLLNYLYGLFNNLNILFKLIMVGG